MHAMYHHDHVYTNKYQYQVTADVLYDLEQIKSRPQVKVMEVIKVFMHN